MKQKLPKEVHEALILITIPHILKIKNSWWHIWTLIKKTSYSPNFKLNEYENLILEGHRPLNVIQFFSQENGYETLSSTLLGFSSDPETTKLYEAHYRVIYNAKQRLYYVIERMKLFTTVSVGISYLFPILFSSIFIMKGLIPALLTFSLFPILLIFRKAILKRERTWKT